MLRNVSLPSSSIELYNRTVATPSPAVNNRTVTTASPHIEAIEPLTSLIIRLTLTSVIFLCTVVGNSLTIHVIRSNHRLTSIKNYYYGYYILNLSVSDLLVGFICVPFTVIYYLTEKWPFESFLCRLLPTMQIMVVSASVSTLSVITFERFMAIVHPMKPRSTLRRLKIIICVIWIWSFLVGLPTFINFKLFPDLPSRQCQEVWSKRTYRQAYTIFLFLVNYAIPLIFMFIAYSRIIYELQSRENLMRTPGNQALHKKFLKLMLILVAGFALCYLPGNIMYFLLDFGNVAPDNSAFMIALNYSHVLIWFNSCLNPFIYGSLDTYFKRGFKRAIGMNESDSQDRQSMINSSVYGESRFSRASYRFSNYKSSPKPENRDIDRLKQISNGKEQSRNGKVRFSPHSTPDLQRTNQKVSLGKEHKGSLSPLVKESINENCIKERPLSAGNGFVSLVLFQSKNKTNFFRIEDINDNDDVKTVPGDAFNRKPPFDYHFLSSEEFITGLQLSNETNV